MNEQIVKFIVSATDGGNDKAVLVRVCGNDITVDIIDKIKSAIRDYQKENKGEWDAEACFDVAKELLESAGYEVYFINPSYEICF